MADLASTSRTQNGGARPVPVVGREQIGRTVTPPTVIMKLRQEREEKRAQDEARRQEQEGIERERRRRSAEQRAAAAAAASAAAGAAVSGAGSQEGAEYRRPVGSRRPPDDYGVTQIEGGPRPSIRGPSSGPFPDPETPVRRRPESGLPQPVQGNSRARTNVSSNPQPRPVPQQNTRAATSAAQEANPQPRTTMGSTLATNQAQAAPSSTAYSRGQTGSQPAPGQSRNGTTSSFPHAFERWEQLSAHWEGLTSYWIKRLEGNSEEISHQPINQQLARQVTDLSAAGANLFHAVVELQRLRASSERKFQRWFFETRSEQERTQERIAQLETDLGTERDSRARDAKTDAKAEADRAQVELAKEYRRLADDQLKEMRRELQISRDEARRGWEEIGRLEQAERDRTYSLKRGQPTLVGGVQVVPMLQGGASRQTSSSRERVGGAMEGDPAYALYDAARSDTDTDPYVEGGHDNQVPPVPQLPASQSYQAPGTSAPAAGQSARTAATQGSPSHRQPGTAASGPATSQYERVYPQPIPQPFYQHTGSGTALHEEGLPPAQDVDARSYVHSEVSEEDFELDENGRIRRDSQGNPMVARRPAHREEPEGYSQSRYTSAAAPPAPVPPGFGGVSNGHSVYTPDYSGAGYGWEGIPRHQHPTRLSDVLEEEDERSRTSPSRTSERSRGVH